MIIARQGGIGRLRFILLNALKYIPLFGYYFYQHCFIFMNRDNFEAHKAVSTMDYIKKKQLSCWIVAYPEVDRFNPQKPKVIEGSRQFAMSKIWQFGENKAKAKRLVRKLSNSLDIFSIK
ncbi:hypothetical protein ACTXT7_008914 [Hymenolepis weldensis]